MISVSSDMILRAVLASATPGILCGALYSVILGIYRLLSGAFLKLIKHTGRARKNPFSENVYDFIFTLAMGIGFVLILYVFTDGVFYFLPLFALFITFFLTKRALDLLFAPRKQKQRKNMHNLRFF